MRTLPQWFRDERKKLAGYGLRDVVRYAWQYYRLWIIGSAFSTCFFGYALYQYLTVPGEIHFYGILSNTYAQLGQGTEFYNGFIEMAGYDLHTGVVELDCANYCKPSGRAIGNTYYEKLISMMDSGTLDVWIAEAEDVVAVGEGGRLMDLSAEAAQSIQERYGDRFVSCKPLRDTYSKDPVPIGIDLSGTALTGPYSAYPNGAVLAINAYTKRMEEAFRFVDYIFQYAGK